MEGWRARTEAGSGEALIFFCQVVGRAREMLYLRPNFGSHPLSHFLWRFFFVRLWFQAQFGREKGIFRQTRVGTGRIDREGNIVWNSRSLPLLPWKRALRSRSSINRPRVLGSADRNNTTRRILKTDGNKQPWCSFLLSLRSTQNIDERNNMAGTMTTKRRI